jgi:hypothetical protein
MRPPSAASQDLALAASSSSPNESTASKQPLGLTKKIRTRQRQPVQQAPPLPLQTAQSARPTAGTSNLEAAASPLFNALEEDTTIADADGSTAEMGVIRKKTATRGGEGGVKYVCDVCSADITSTVSISLFACARRHRKVDLFIIVPKYDVAQS